MLSGHLVYLALGSNLGNRANNIYEALAAINEYATVETTSFLYETAAAYYTEQPNFINAVCKVSTHLSPTELLRAVETTMAELGRVRTVDKGPRVIDIDILLYDDLQFESPELIIPHPEIAERDFVLEPLCDVAKTVRHPILQQTFFDLWRMLGTQNLQKVIPISDEIWAWGGQQKTYVMGVLNRATDQMVGSCEEAVSRAEQLVEAGADMVDIDAHKIKPMQTQLSVEQEIARAIPIVEAVKHAVDVPISINTYSYAVAQAAVEAGARFLNYRCNLHHAEQICGLATTAQIPLVLTFNPQNNCCTGAQYNLATTPASEQTYAQGSFFEAVRHELRQMRIVSKTNGLPRWSVVQSLGLSLMNESRHSLQLAQNLSDFAQGGYPLLVDPTHANLLGHEQPEGEDLALSTLAAAHGATFVRTYNVKTVSNALQITNALRLDTTQPLVRQRGK